MSAVVRRLRRALGLALCMLIWAASASSGQTPAALPTIRVGASLDDYSTPLVYADRAGLFEKAGVHVETVFLNGGDAVTAAVAGRALDVGKSNTLALIVAHTKGVPFTVIAPAAYSASNSAQSAILVAADSPIRSARDLIGKTIGVVGLVSSQSLMMKAWLDKNGGHSQKTHFIEVHMASVPSLLDQNRIDAAPLFDPYLTQAMSTGKYRVIGHMYEVISKRVEDADYFTTTDWASKNPDLVRRFARAIHDANVSVAAHEDATIPLIASLTHIDPAVLARMQRPGRPAYVEPADIQQLIDLAARYGFIRQPFPAHQLISDLALVPPK